MTHNGDNGNGDTGRAGMQGMEALFKGAKGEKGDPGPAMGDAARRAIIYLFLLTVAFAVANLFWTAHEVGHVRQAVQVACRFDADLGSAPITLAPGTHKPALLGVTIVSDARVAWHQLNCSGNLPSPAPSFAYWARFYKLPYQ